MYNTYDFKTTRPLKALMTLFSEPVRPVGLSKALVPEELLAP